ncbi:hypothetical protein CONCODRAFT_3755 [Conidiobolus coronatus NRRL 28638]|uniref:Uncharacterized protein n=1 Tax=Conidiobolus coronatus (strain ATCC 28846 / CBS 209.66 / NRRL 28638) TaxID=796925 RepID=A0A137PE72_CONC2|nr:hypothetical protein CONCODRAFT_3755 [Conidiobolus coronatus NRRL 28638]|eukprot:KXN73280.1 hypothetical protein CONCODRAFT_3755 [Conidiobolus coronatus NRRL 28638]
MSSIKQYLNSKNLKKLNHIILKCSHPDYFKLINNSNLNLNSIQSKNHEFLVKWNCFTQEFDLLNQLLSSTNRCKDDKPSKFELIKLYSETNVIDFDFYLKSNTIVNSDVNIIETSIELKLNNELKKVYTYLNRDQKINALQLNYLKLIGDHLVELNIQEASPISNEINKQYESNIENSLKLKNRTPNNGRQNNIRQQYLKGLKSHLLSNKNNNISGIKS